MATSADEKKRVRRILTELEKKHPDAKLDLDFATPLELLVALILAAQCTDQKVNEVTAGLFRRYRTAAAYARESQEALEEQVRPTGFYRQKTKAIRACCQRIVERHDGIVPNRLEDLLALPGVGRKTANILLGNAFGVPGIGVDTHVGRLSRRLGLTRETDPDRIEADLVELVPDKARVRFCHLLQYHGRRTCKARSPDCPGCAVRALCPYPEKTPPREQPARATRSRWIP